MCEVCVEKLVVEEENARVKLWRAGGEFDAHCGKGMHVKSKVMDGGGE